MYTGTGTGPAARRRVLGKQLRALRGTRSAAEAAKQARISQPTLSRIEGGRGALMPRNVASLLAAYGVEGPQAEQLMSLAASAEERGWWDAYSDVIAQSFEMYASLEADAAEIQTYEAEFVPGLMQTADVVRALRLASHPKSTPEELDRSVALRMERQRQLRAQVSAVVNEAVVCRPIGSEPVWKEQLDRLRAEAAAGRLRILPFAAGAHPGMGGAFSMLRFDDTEEMDLVYAGTERGSMYFEKPADLLRYAEVFHRLHELALSPEESAERLATLAQQPRRGGCILGDERGATR